MPMFCTIISHIRYTSIFKNILNISNSSMLYCCHYCMLQTLWSGQTISQVVYFKSQLISHITLEMKGQVEQTALWNIVPKCSLCWLYTEHYGKCSRYFVSFKYNISILIIIIHNYIFYLRA